MAEEKKEQKTEDTLALIKPDAFPRAYEIINRILKEGFEIINQKQVVLTKVRAKQFYAEHDGKSFFNDLVNFMTSGAIYALQLRSADAIKKWRKLMGPTKREIALKEDPNCIRSLFGTDTTKNASHGSDSPDSAKRELEFFFGTQQTLGLIKPDAIESKNDEKIINRIISEGFTIIEKEKIQLTKERAEAFYAEHKGKGFFNDLVNFMTSGPIIALKLESINAIKKWRKLMGPTKREIALKEDPNCLRSLYGTNTTKNACHGSDSIDSASRELNFYFPQEQTFAMIKPDAIKNKYENKILKRIIDEGFIIKDFLKKKLTIEDAKNFYIEHKERSFYNELVQYMTSGPVYILKLQRFNAVKKWRDVMGPTFTNEAKKSNPNCIRALYGHTNTENATHGSDSIKSAKRELEFNFKNGSSYERTLGIIKPHVLKDGNKEKIINLILYNDFYIVNMKEIQLTKEKAEQFYGEHKGKPFFNGLVNMMTSGKCVVLKLERRNAIKYWRSIMGPTKYEVCQKEAPNSIRGKYAKDTTKNAVHGSDSEQSSKRELDFFFKE